MSEVTIPNLPFKRVDNVSIQSRDSNNSDVYELNFEDKSFVIKDIRDSSFTLENFPGENIQEKATSIKNFFSVIREYLGNRAWNTSFIVAENSESEPCLRVIQRKVDGYRLKDIESRLDPNAEEKIEQIIEENKKKLERAFDDPRLQKADSSKAIDWVRRDAFYEKNVFIKSDGQVVFVDLI